MSDLPNECCGRCRFWFMYGQPQHVNLDRWTNGKCERYPPPPRTGVEVIDVKGRQVLEVMQERPTVSASDWCGEFQKGPGRNGGAE